MLIESNTAPTNTIYFIGHQLIEMFLKWKFQSKMQLEEMYGLYARNYDDIGMIKFIYALDRLFILGVIDFNQSHITFVKW